MNSFTRYVIVVICILLQNVLSDYTCICNYNVEKAIFSAKSEQGQPIGYMYEFDCKYQLGADENGWLSIAFEHQVGYINKDGQTMVQICAGSPPDEDLVTTTPAPPTTSSTTELTSTVKSTITLISTTPKTFSSQITSTNVPSTSTSAFLSTDTVPTTSSSVLSSKATLPIVSTTMLLSSSSATTILPSTTVNLTKTSSQPPATITTLQTTTPPTPVTSSQNTMTSTTTTMKATHTSTTSATTSPSRSTSTTTQTTLKTSTKPPIVTSTTQPIPTTIDTTPSCSELLKDIVAKDNGTLFAYKDKCFELLRIHTNWVNAELECRRKGGHLIEIDDSIEQRVVHQVIETYYHESVWIGLHDRHHEERFEWTSGKAVAYTNWYPGRKDPDNHYSEDCVAMALNKYSGQWEDRNCDENRGFICQFGRHTLKVPALIG